MKQILSLLVVVFCFISAVLAQTPRPAPTPGESDVVKITTSLIQLDVTVTDKKGNVITDLKKGELEIYENGKKQDISNFDFVAGAKSEIRKKSDERSTNLIPTPGSQRPENVRRTIALVVDDLSLSFESTYWVQASLKKFIREQMQDGDLVAIIRTGSGIGALQQFTTDKRQLLAAAEKVRFNLGGARKGGLFNPLEPLGSSGTSGRSDDDTAFDRELSEFRDSIFASGTLGALNFIIRGMKDLPGRKSIMLLSDGFPLVIRDDRGLPQGSRILFQLRRLTDLANRASVVIYTLDAKGLDAPGLTASDNTNDMTGDQIERALNDRRNAVFDSQEGLRYLAQQTGGISIINQSDLTKGIQRVLNDQSYYLVGYEPDDASFDPKIRRYNKIEIKVLREGSRVRYRSGFFGISDEKIPVAQLTGSQALLNALTSPFAINDLSVRMNTMFTAGDGKTNYLKSYLHLDANDLTFVHHNDGTYKTVFEVVALTFGDNGTVADEHSQAYTITMKEDAYRKILEKGFVYDFALPVKKTGGLQMRVAVRDPVTNKVGSANQFVEIPNLKKNRLTLSGIAFESMSMENWQRVSANPAEYSGVRSDTDPRTDTALRRFRQGTMLRYGIDIYNARKDASGKPQLSRQVRIYRDGKEFFVSEDMPISSALPLSVGGITATGAIRLGQGMPPGEYIVQVVVTDSLAKDKYKVASQFVSFELVEQT
jgi:VWFA-related protein